MAVTALTGAHLDHQLRKSATIKTARHPCYGYTIIEFGTGIDCNGDTIRLVKVLGGQERLHVDPSPGSIHLAKK